MDTIRYKKGHNTIRRSSSRNGKRIVKIVTHVRFLDSANQILNIVLRNHNINSMNFRKKIDCNVHKNRIISYTFLFDVKYIFR